MTADHDAFRRFLERATEDPESDPGVPGVIRLEPHATDRHGPDPRPSRSRFLVLIAAVLLLVVAVTGILVLRRGSGRSGDQVATAPPGDGVPVLVLAAGAIPTGDVAADGASVVTATGPDLTLERRGTGRIEAAGSDGRRFVPGGQQRDDAAFVTRVGVDVGELVDARGGTLDVRFRPLVDMTARTTPTGRNIHTYVEVVSEAGADHLVLGASLQVDPEIGPYLSGAIGSRPWIHTLTADEIERFGAGDDVELRLEWTPSTGFVLLNGSVIATVELSAGSPRWRDTARLSVGGSATYGAGYFTLHDDALLEVTMTRAPTS